MKTVVLETKADFGEWRHQARQLLLNGESLENILWSSTLAPDLFGNDMPTLFDNEKQTGRQKTATFFVPKRFLNMAQNVICHNNDDSAALLYRLLYRLQTDKNIFEKIYDSDVATALSREKAVCQDIHRMHAFLRFTEVPPLGQRRCFRAWYEPQHFIIRKAAPFFFRRFNNMDWLILTPKGSVIYVDEKLTFGEPVEERPQNRDQMEELWKTYFSHIFNPARLKVKTMRSHMPKKFWGNLPEAQLIDGLISKAEKRVERMENQLCKPPPLFHQRLRDKVHQTMNLNRTHYESINDINKAIKSCNHCPLHCYATQAVCGEGTTSANLMIVGEQPGNQEDLAGRPFVGPAGQVFDSTAKKVGIKRSEIYITNAVKHFKYQSRGKRCIHKKANRNEIEHCRWWLLHEIQLVKPKLIVAMGKTALFSLTGISSPITQINGKIFATENKTPVLSTFHPAYLLRINLKQAQHQAMASFEQSLEFARHKVNE